MEVEVLRGQLAAAYQHRKAYGRPFITAQSILQCGGFAWAKKHGVLDMYRDAWGVNMCRPADAWKTKWHHHFADIEAAARVALAR